MDGSLEGVPSWEAGGVVHVSWRTRPMALRRWLGVTIDGDRHPLLLEFSGQASPNHERAPRRRRRTRGASVQRVRYRVGDCTGEREGLETRTRPPPPRPRQAHFLCVTRVPAVILAAVTGMSAAPAPEAGPNAPGSGTSANTGGAEVGGAAGEGTG